MKKDNTREYVCTKDFSIGMIDEDGFQTDRYLDILLGSIWVLSTDAMRVVGGKDSIRLTSEKYGWLELTKEHFDEYFTKLKR